MQISKNNKYQSEILNLGNKIFRYFPLKQLDVEISGQIDSLPYCIRIFLENAIRNYNGETIADESILALTNWSKNTVKHGVFSFMPGRILLQDLSGVPLIVDLASLRSTATKNGKDPSRINPLIPVDLVIDHSVQVDFAGSCQAYSLNSEIEYRRNHERYKFLRWAQGSIDNIRVIPPDSGIVHQINLEYLALVAMTSIIDGENWVYPDSVLGTDSHTTMVNGMGVLGWGVGGIEAVAAMLNQPVETLIPEVVGVEVTGQINEGSSPTDIVLTLTHMLRQVGVVNKMVEFFGTGLDALTIPDRAMLANMAPEYGATAAYFPLDESVMDYLLLTGRSVDHIELVKTYYKTQGLFRTSNSPIPAYSPVVQLSLDEIEPCLAGPKRPQDLVPVPSMSHIFQSALVAPVKDRGFGLTDHQTETRIPLNVKNEETYIEHGSVVIAAITACTNTSNPFALISAGLLAKNAVALGLRAKPFVKTSLAPGSKTVKEYLQKAGLLEPLEQLGFHIVGYGCTTCIGNSGPLDPAVSQAIQENQLIAAAVISGNRNFEGRIHPLVQANYLASPALVIAYAICGNVQKNLLSEPIGFSNDHSPVFLKDIWPSNRDVQAVIDQVITPDVYNNTYAQIMEGDEKWQSLQSSPSLLYPWESSSTYIRETPFCEPLKKPFTNLTNARILAILGDSVTTDHISPAGAIASDCPAAEYLKGKGISPEDFNTYGSRRGNHEIMMRGTFANIHLKNNILPGVEGGYTIHYPDGEKTSIFDAAMQYQDDGVDLVVLAGKEYGTGSSRDWAAKGPLLLGVKAVIAESFERIHRSNLVGMGILPLQFISGDNANNLMLKGSEFISLSGLDEIKPGCFIPVIAKKTNGNETSFHVRVVLNSIAEIELWKNRGILRSFKE